MKMLDWKVEKGPEPRGVVPERLAGHSSVISQDEDFRTVGF